ncbi:50S ribosomal protein L35 [Proteinivorax hydrogeniformans]|uniref:Large ribosomal subunit protein bL35 n=1 Tax=Proteinivorax hydrogeniformans TaxID=1826727 RepID=A0AAU8HRB0_9FIRM
MPKMKTHSGAKKRFKRNKNGKIKRSSAFAEHIKTKKTSKRKRQLRKGDLVSKSDEKRIGKLLP